MFQANLLLVPNSEQVNRFKQSLQDQTSVYGIELSGHLQGQLTAYYELLLRWNQRLHLVAPCSPEEFASRHVLESLALLDHLPEGATVADIGSGAGLPIIPCLVVRQDITATLFESSQKKSVFLHEALKTVDALKRAKIVSRRFEGSPLPKAEFITCRALDDFSAQLDALIRWAPKGSTLLLFGGDNLLRHLSELSCDANQFLLPGSQRRFLCEVVKDS
jgi:16S rRNA (guanine527-N7)-methyltransferase